MLGIDIVAQPEGEAEVPRHPVFREDHWTYDPSSALVAHQRGNQQRTLGAGAAPAFNEVPADDPLDDAIADAMVEARDLVDYVLMRVAILGGIGRPYGAMAGGLVVGVAEELSTYAWIGSEPLISPGYKQGVAFAIMVIMLIWRPSGLFRGRVF